MSEPMVAQTVSVNGADLHYIEQGTGEPVIFVHGSLGDYRTWAPQMDAFAQNYRVISYSRRYHDPNVWSGEATDYTVSLHANDLIGLIEALRLAPANVVGNSFGAYTTLLAAARRPDLFRKVVAGEPPILPLLQEIPGGQVYYDGFMQGTWHPAREAFQSGDLEHGVRLFIDSVSGAPIFDQIPPAPRGRMLDNARSLMAETLSPDYFTEITPQQVAQIPVPVLLLKGEHSPKMFQMIVDHLAEAMPHPRVETIPDASHSMPSNNPAVYNRVVMDFLAE